jgi:hypothetical protein
MLVCQFITAEYFRVEVPEQIASAAAPSADDRTLTLAILPDGPGTLYAVGPARLAAAPKGRHTIINNQFQRRPIYPV